MFEMYVRILLWCMNVLILVCISGFTGQIVQIIAQTIVANYIDQVRLDLTSKGYDEKQINEIDTTIWNKIGKCRIFRLWSMGD